MTALMQAAAALRAEVQAILPENAFLRIDRTGQALYVVVADDLALSLLRTKGWTCECAGRVHRISPGGDHLTRMRALVDPHPQWAAFTARPTDSAILPLFSALLRALELPPVPSARNKLEKQLRQSAAVALRTGSGGGLELCHNLFTIIQTQI